MEFGRNHIPIESKKWDCYFYRIWRFGLIFHSSAGMGPRPAACRGRSTVSQGFWSAKNVNNHAAGVAKNSSILPKDSRVGSLWYWCWFFWCRVLPEWRGGGEALYGCRCALIAHTISQCAIWLSTFRTSGKQLPCRTSGKQLPSTRVWIWHQSLHAGGWKCEIFSSNNLSHTTGVIGMLGVTWGTLL